MTENPWIEWEGGDRPLPPYTEIEVEFGNGDRSLGCACDFEWGYLDAESDIPAFHEIAAYRLTGPSA